MKRPSIPSFVNKNAVLFSFGFFCLAAFAAGIVLTSLLYKKTQASPVENNAPTRFVTLTALPEAPSTQRGDSLTAAPSTLVIPPALPAATRTPLPPSGDVFSIGASAGGYSLDVYRFGEGPVVRMIIGGIHGGYEANTSALADALVGDLENGNISVPQEITLYILPVFNPDGLINYPNSVKGRSNSNGVDLNRNWDAFWQAEWDKTGCFSSAPITAGEFAFSEPETQALRDFLLNNHVDAIISYHSAMAAIFAGGQPEPDPASGSLARALEKASPYSYPPVNDGGCQYTGQLIDWASKNDIAAVDIELTDHKYTDIEINRKILRAFLNWEH